MMPRHLDPTIARHAVAGALLVISLTTSPALAAGNPRGIWLDDTGRGAVEISDCGKALCGKVVWVKSKRDGDGCGKAILGGVKSAGRGRWDYGWIYSPEHGRKFDVELTPVGNDRLRVTGYAGIKLFSESHTWKRAPADLMRCDGVVTAKADVAATLDAPAATSKAQTQPATETSAPESAATTPAPAEPNNDAAPTATDSNQPDATTAQGETDTSAAAEPGKGMGGLAIEKVLKKTANGKCKLDLPWVKIDFDCKDF